MLEGRRLLDQGRVDAAIPKLVQATELMPTNALAWSSLGVAYHQAGRFDPAHKAYQTALKLDFSMGAVRFNLGCLYLDMNNVGAALDELRAFTLLQPNSTEGWLKLGTAQYRARRLDEAEKSFKTLLSLQGHSPDGWNGQGLVQVQRRRWSEAASSFAAAISADTNFAPAQLNAAVLQHQYLNNRPLALQHYRRYLQLAPDATDDVRAAVAQLERELGVSAQTTRPAVPSSRASSPGPGSPATLGSVSTPAPPPGATANGATSPIGSPSGRTSSAGGAATPSSGILGELRPNSFQSSSSSGPAQASNAAPPSTAGGSRPSTKPGDVAATAAPTGSTAPTPIRPPCSSRPPEPSKASGPTPAPSGAPAPGPVASRPGAGTDTPLETARVRDGLVVRPPSDSTGGPVSPAARAAADSVDRSAENTPPPLKKGFFARLNPFNRGAKGSNQVETATPPAGERGSHEIVRPEGLPELAPAVTRYVYVAPKRPADGNREAAVAEFKRGVKAQKAGDRARAAADYQAAFRADPGFFDAYYNLGLLALDSSDTRLSLWSYEVALAIQPDSADARYNLSLALKAGGYPLDAADQLQIILQQNPADARAHLSLANLYAQQLRQPARAREHYLRVLELNPRHPDAATIRYWLAANP